MPIELWIVLGIIGLGLAGAGALRLRRGRRTQAEDAARNIYTLW